MITFEECNNIIKKRMSECRYLHCVNVAESAVQLARKYGADESKSKIAGLLHDITKEMPIQEQRKLIDKYGIELNEIESKTPKLWHSISGSLFVKYELGVKDEDIINAIRHHTSAAKGMTILEKVLYVADFISAERDYPGVEKIRAVAKKDLDLCVLEGLVFSIQDLVNKNSLIHPDTVEAYNELLLKINFK